MTCEEKVRQLNELIQIVGDCAKKDALGKSPNYGRELVATRRVLAIVLGRKPSEAEIIAAREESWKGVQFCGCKECEKNGH